MSEKKINEDGVGAGAIAGYQLPLGLQKRREKLEALLKKRGIMPEAAGFVFEKADPTLVEQFGQRLDESREAEAMECYGAMAREAMVRELIKKRVREVVRKKPGGGGYVLYRPNQGKKKPAKAVGEFPTKLGAKKAELARFAPKDPRKLARLRKQVDRMLKDPKKRADAEARAKRVKNPGASKGHKAHRATDKAPEKKEEALAYLRAQLQEVVERELLGEAVGWVKYQLDWADESDEASNDPVADAKKVCDTLRQKFKAVARVVKSVGPNGYPVLDIAVPEAQKAAFERWMIDEYSAGNMDQSDVDAHRVKEDLKRELAGMLREALFHEERDESAWDDVVAKMPQKVASADKKLQSLQKSISKKAEGVLQDAYNQVAKACKKSAKMKSFGVKRDTQRGKTYIAFSASFDNVAVEPMYIYVEGGVPKIEISDQAKVALTKVEPKSAKAFRAELVLVQERVLDRMDDLQRAVVARDRYLERVQDGVDDYVAGLSPLELSLLKQLLVKKYRKLG